MMCKFLDFHSAMWSYFRICREHMLSTVDANNLLNSLYLQAQFGIDTWWWPLGQPLAEAASGRRRHGNGHPSLFVLLV